MVNWFRQGEDGRFLWPGFGDNMRVLKWILDRVEGRVLAQETPVGWVPQADSLDTEGLDASAEDMAIATKVDLNEWRAELESTKEWFEKIGDDLPNALRLQRELLLERVNQLAE